MRVQEVAVRTHYPNLYRAERTSRMISFAILLITAAAAFFLFLLAVKKETPDQDIKTMGIMTACSGGAALVLSIGSSVCGCVRERLDNRRNGVLAQAELALLV